jgi:hypothetical protein
MSGPNGCVQATELAGVPTSCSGVDSPVISSGKVSCGIWTQPVGSFNLELIDGVPAENLVVIAGPGVVPISSSKQQCGLSISIGAGTVQLSATVTDSTNAQSQSPEQSVSWSSDNIMIATVNSSGLVTLLRKGQAVIKCTYSRAVVRATPTTTPSGTEGVYAECLVTIGA